MLTKKYVFEASSSGDASFYLDHTVATKISWLPGRDLTKKAVQVKVVNRRTGNSFQVPCISLLCVIIGRVSMADKEVFVPSFFTFFNAIVPLPDEIAEDEEGDVAARQEALQTDFSVGETFKDDIVPHATKFFQGRDLTPADLSAPEGGK